MIVGLNGECFSGQYSCMMMNRPGTSPISSLFAALRGAGTGLLLLDYDGTLAPFDPDRWKARPPADIRDALEAILEQGRTRVAFVTGRPARELVAVSGITHSVEVWGCHGREFLDARGNLHLQVIAEDFRRRLLRAEASARAFVPAQCLEAKTGCVAFHGRALPPEERIPSELRVRAAWDSLADEGGLLLKSFDGGIEICAPGRTKGDAVADLLQRHPREAGVTAFLGDDLTDEDGFRALRGRGLSILVRDQPRDTLADWTISSHRELADFLGGWHASLEGGGSR
jgi:trehalose 6-phosphate phosphatase